MSFWGPAMFFAVLAMIFTGYPVAFALGGTALIFALIGSMAGVFDIPLLFALPERTFGTMSNFTLLAVPFFIFMGTVLEKSKLAEQLLETIGLLFGRFRGGLAIGVIFVGALLAAATGVVGASVTAMGLISLPVMLRNGYKDEISLGTIAAAGTLGQIIPPSIVLVLLGDTMANAYADAQRAHGAEHDVDHEHPQPPAARVGELREEDRRDALQQQREAQRERRELRREHLDAVREDDGQFVAVGR